MGVFTNKSKDVLLMCTIVILNINPKQKRLWAGLTILIRPLSVISGKKLCNVLLTTNFYNRESDQCLAGMSLLIWRLILHLILSF